MFNLALVAELKSRITYLEKEIEYHRKRADLAVDELLRKRESRPIMPDKFIAPSEQIRREAEFDIIRSEFEKVGDLGGEDYIESEKNNAKIEIQ